MTRTVLIAAGPRLAGLLAEQFEALGGFAPRVATVDNDGLADLRAFDAAILDTAFCDAPVLAQRLRDQGFSGAIVLIDAGVDANADRQSNGGSYGD